MGRWGRIVLVRHVRYVRGILSKEGGIFLPDLSERRVHVYLEAEVVVRP